MPWSTPSLKDVRGMTRDFMLGQLRAIAMVPNSITRVLSDAMAGLGHLCLLYVDWLARQLLPDTSETEWLDRHATIWLANADGSRGRKLGTFAVGSVTMTGVFGNLVPQFTQMTSADGMTYETTEQIMIGDAATPVGVRALTEGKAGNGAPGDTLGFVIAIAGVDGIATVVTLTGGSDEETDDELRARVLDRIQQPPMGGDAEDYVQWALRVGGVTRAWSAPNEMGIGTCTIRFMADDLRSDNAGFPLQQDIDAVTAYLDTVRPVCVKDRFVEAPIPEPIDFTILGLNPDTPSVRAEIANSVAGMLHLKAKPGFAVDGVTYPAQTIYAVWVSDAVLNSPGVSYFDLIMADHIMPDNGHMAVLGTITYSV